MDNEDVIFIQEKKKCRKPYNTSKKSASKLTESNIKTVSEPKTTRKYTKRANKIEATSSTDGITILSSSKAPRVITKMPKCAALSPFHMHHLFNTSNNHHFGSFGGPSSSSSFHGYSGHFPPSSADIDPICMEHYFSRTTMPRRHIMVQQGFIRNFPYSLSNMMGSFVPPEPGYFPVVDRRSTFALSQSFPVYIPTIRQECRCLEIFEESAEYLAELGKLLDPDQSVERDHLNESELWENNELEEMLLQYGLDSDSETNLETPAFTDIFQICHRQID